jgi:hypothetical protein
MAKWGDGPGWTIDQAMQVLTVLHPAFRENGYALAMHGSVSRDGKGNDLDLVAVPEELCVTPPEEMERMMCDLIGAQPAQQEPNRGLLGTWSRACVLEDGRGIDMEYRLPAPINRRHEWASSLITLFRYNGYHLEFFSFPERLNANHFDLIALPLTLNATSPEAMDQLIFEKLQAPLLSDPVESSMSVRSYQSDDGRKIGIRFARPAVGGVGGDNVSC